MTELKVRVNPNNPSEFATLSEPKDHHRWYRSSVNASGRGDWLTDTRVKDWSEFTLNIPTPERAFRPGDVVRVHRDTNRIRVRNKAGGWVDVTTGQFAVYADDIIHRDLGSTYTFVGNVADLEA